MYLKNIPKEAGVYKITNIVSGKIYIGNSINLRRRAHQHKYSYKSNDSLLYLDMRTFGINCFSFEVIELLKVKELLTDRESFWIKTLNSEYNINGKKSLLSTDSTNCLTYNTQDVSELLNVGINEVCDLIIKKEIPFVKFDNAIRYPKSRFNEYLTTRNSKSQTTILLLSRSS